MINKKSKTAIFLLLFISFIFTSNLIFAAGPIDPGASTPTGQITITMPKLWGTISLIVQLIAIGCIVFAGVRYMFASSGGRADIKKSMGYLIVGSMITFGAITIVKVVIALI